MLSVRVDSIDRDVELLIKETLSDKAKSAIIADEAKKALAAGERQNNSVLGRVPQHTTYVDGNAGGDEARVRPEGTILYEFDVISDLFVWIADQLNTHAPLLTGRYKSSFTLYADGKEVQLGAQIPPDAEEYVFTNVQPYARKIEQGSSTQAPDGVFQAVALLARSRFGNAAKIEFTYRGLIGLSSGSGTLAKRGRAANRSDARFPAIVVTLR